MFCNNCGNEIPENSKFCGSCGAATQEPATTASHASQEQKQEKKRSPIWLSFIIIASVFLIGKFVIAPSMSSKHEPNNGSFLQEETKASSFNYVSASSEYSEIFLSRNIVEAPALFLMLDSSAFAVVNEDGMIEKLEFGYKNDTIKEMVNTLYIPVSDIDDAQKNELDAAVKENFASSISSDFCSVSYDMGYLYYTVTVHFTGLDSSKNIQKLSEFGMLIGDDVTYLSMAETENSLIAAGYVKR